MVLIRQNIKQNSAGLVTCAGRRVVLYLNPRYDSGRAHPNTRCARFFFAFAQARRRPIILLSKSDVPVEHELIPLLVPLTN